MFSPKKKEVREHRYTDKLERLQKSYEETCEQSSVPFDVQVPEIKIPTFEESAEQYDALYNEFNEEPQTSSMTGRVYNYFPRILVLPAILPPSNEEYDSEFNKIYNKLRRNHRSGISNSEINYMTSVETFHLFEVQFAKRVQNQNLLLLDFFRDIDLYGIEKRKTKILAAIKETRDLDPGY